MLLARAPLLNLFSVLFIWELKDDSTKLFPHDIDGQSVTFLAGTIIGYLLTYLGGYVTPEE